MHRFKVRSCASIAYASIAALLFVPPSASSAPKQLAIAPPIVITASAFTGPFDLTASANGPSATWLTAGDAGGLASNAGVERQASKLALRPPEAFGTHAPQPGNPNAFVAGIGDVHGTLTWNDGNPDANNAGQAYQWSVAGRNTGFSVVFPGSSSPDTVNTATIFTAAYCAQTQVTVHASDGTFPDQTDTYHFSDENVGTGSDYVYNIVYRTNSPGTIKVSFTNIDAAKCPKQTGAIAFRGELFEAGMAAQLPQSKSVVSPALHMRAFPRPVATPAGTIPVDGKAAQADKFVDSIGVMTFFGVAYNPTSVYYNNLAAAQSLIVNAGIRHIRDHTQPYGYAGYNNVTTNFGPLHAAGVTMDYVTTLATTKAQLIAAETQTDDMIDQFEPPNEPNDVGNANWLAQTEGYQKSLYTWIKKSPSTSTKSVLGPSIIGAPELFLDIKDYMDFGNSHGYQGSHNPETPGYGSRSSFGTYGSTDYHLHTASMFSYSKPIEYTEAGYGSMPTGQSYANTVIDYYAGLRYTPRLYFWHFMKGIPRTYQGELIDDKPLTSQAPYSQFGLVDQSMRVKPAYTAVSEIIALLRDKGPSFTPTPLAYTLSGSTKDVYHELLQKRDGTYWLAVWLGVKSWDSACGTSGHPACTSGDIAVNSQSVTLTTKSKLANAAVYTSDERGHYTSASVAGWTGNSGVIPVTDKITLLRLSSRSSESRR